MIYLDNSATTAPSEEVLASFIEVNKRFYANPSSLHRLGKEAETLLERSRQQILAITDAPGGEVVFTSGGTEANNLALIGLARQFQTVGKHIITSEIEHPSILQTVKYLAQEGFEVDYLSVNDQGVISVDELAEKIRKDTVLVSIMHVNNEIGAVQPIDDCAAIIKKNSRAIFHVDVIQSFGKLAVSLEKSGLDAISVSGHKINGLKGSGALILRKGIKIQAVNFGGGQEKGMRNGTVSVPNATTLARVMRISTEKSRTKNYEQWRNQLIQHVEKFNDVLVLARDAGAPHILSLAFWRIKGEVAVNFFQENGIIVSTSSACSSKKGHASHVIDAIRLPERFKHGVIRISFGGNTMDEDINHVEKVLSRFVELLGRGKSNEVE